MQIYPPISMTYKRQRWSSTNFCLLVALLVCRSNIFFTGLRCLFHLATVVTLDYNTQRGVPGSPLSWPFSLQFLPSSSSSCSSGGPLQDMATPSSRRWSSCCLSGWPGWPCRRATSLKGSGLIFFWRPCQRKSWTKSWTWWKMFHRTSPMTP